MLKIVGDINFSDGFFDIGFGIGTSIKNGADPFTHIQRKKDDLWLGNLECVIANQSDKSGIYRKQFIISPIALENIHHLDIYNVANNHVMQHGDNAYKEILKYIDSVGSKYIGSNDIKNIKIEHQGKKIGIMSFSQRYENFSDKPLYWYNPEYKDIELSFESLNNTDFKIAYIHWGNEFINRPYSDQKKTAHWLIDLGFDLIVGMHPHILQGYEIYKKKYIFYSLGNFIFNMPLEATKYSIILNVDISREINVNYEYVKIGNDYFPNIIHEDLVPKKYKFKYLNNELKKEVENEIYYSEVRKSISDYRKANYKELLLFLYKFKFNDISAIFLDFIKRKFHYDL